MPTDEARLLPGSVDREKSAVAASSVLAAVALTSMKVVVGVLTGSLGILSEAAHSALDLVAAGMTWFAVRVSGKPADELHTYGHGKIENLSALFETLLLLATCVWIINEAIGRLFFRTVEVEVSIWSFVVMGVSIIIDVSRSRALYRVARKTGSQALEADALHFSTDVWSSSVVIVGLVMVRLASVLGQPWLIRADAVAALGVAGIVVFVSLQLGKRTVAALLDSAPEGVRDRLMVAAQVPGVVEVRQARLRQSGPESFADLTLAIGPGTSLERAHDISSAAEAAVERLIPGVDVVVHLEPADHATDSVVEVARRVAARQGLGAHSIRLLDIPGRCTMELHLEVPDHLSLEAAHIEATHFEASILQALPEIQQVITHIEPSGDEYARRAAAPADREKVLQVLGNVLRELAPACHVHQVEVHGSDDALALSFHCDLPGDVSISDAHDLTERIERALRAEAPALTRVVIRVRPRWEAAGLAA
jgi:cation diffusion facilitator family transporter